mgnify:CR=1 FL=1
MDHHSETMVMPAMIQLMATRPAGQSEHRSNRSVRSHTYPTVSEVGVQPPRTPRPEVRVVGGHRADTTSRTAEITLSCRSFGKDGYIGSEKISPAKRSVTGNDPAFQPRCAKPDIVCTGHG